MSGSGSELSGHIATSVATEADRARTGVALRPEEPAGHSDERDALGAEIRRLYGSSSDLLRRLEALIRRRLGVAPLSPGAPILAAVTGAGIRLSVAMVATLLFGEWSGIPWGRWVVVVGWFAAVEGGTTWMGPADAPPRPRIERILEDWTALLPTIVRESDLRDLMAFTRRWQRPLRAVSVGAAVVATMLAASWVVAPSALGALPPGSVVLLVWLLYDFGTNVVYWGHLYNRAFMAREARYDHDLFWPSPADTPEVRKVMRKTTSQGSGAGWWITVFLAMTLVLVGWDSTLVLPLAVGFVVIGYLSTIGLAFSNRASVRKIIERSRHQRLAVLRRHIETYEARIADLSSEEAAHLRDLLFLHDRVRDAPTTPAHAHTLMRTAAALIVPTIMFVVSVFGEVSAERMLDSLLP